MVGDRSVVVNVFFGYREYSITLWCIVLFSIKNRVVGKSVANVAFPVLAENVGSSENRSSCYSAVIRVVRNANELHNCQ